MSSAFCPAFIAEKASETAVVVSPLREPRRSPRMILAGLSTSAILTPTRMARIASA